MRYEEFFNHQNNINQVLKKFKCEADEIKKFKINRIDCL